MQHCQHCPVPTDTKDWSIWCQDRTKKWHQTEIGGQNVPVLRYRPCRPPGEHVLPFAQQHLPLVYSLICRPPLVELIKAGAMMPGNLPSVVWLVCILPHFQKLGQERDTL